MTTAPLFELTDVSFAAGLRVLLHPLSLSLLAGRVVGLIGHNGSGKSTLVKLLARQQPPSTGSIRFAGKPLAEWSGRHFARQVAYLPQQTPPTAGLLVGELVALGRYPWHGTLGRFGAVDRDRVAEAMRLADVASLSGRQVDTLSGGERQRAWLAMLIAQDARCLLLDEPTSALDIAHQVEVLSLVRRLCRDRGIGVVVVLHDINMAARYCDEMVALRDGCVLMRGTPAELMTPDRLQAIYGVAMDVIRHPRTGEPIGVVG